MIEASSVAAALAGAIDRRARWLETLRDTDAVRLLVGAVEDAPGVTVDDRIAERRRAAKDE